MKKNLFFGKGTQLEKLLLSIGFVSIAVALIIAINSLATGYESSIYLSTPLLVWFLLFLGLSCGIIVSVYSVFKCEENTNRVWVMGLLLVLLVSISIAKMDVIRGYFLYGSGDVFSHVGFIQSILSDGHFYEQSLSIYPIMHIFAIQLYQLLDIELMFTLGVIPIFFYAVFIIFLYFSSRIILHNKGYAIIVTLAGLILFSTPTMFAPTALTPFLFPLFLYLFVKTSMLPKNSDILQFTILFLIVLILLPLSHPIKAFSFALFLISMLLYARFAQYKNKFFFIPLKSGYKVSILVVLVLLIWFITWVSSFYAWDATVKNIYFLLTEGGPTELDALRGKITYAESYGYSATEQFLKVYGTMLILGLSSLIAFPLLIKKMKQNTNVKYLYSFFAPLLLIVVFLVIGYVSNVHHLTRITPLFMIICLLFFGYLIYYMLQHRGRNRYLHKICFFGIVFLLVICSIQSVLRIYPSPYLLNANDQVTLTDVSGMDWFFHNKNVETSIVTMCINKKRFADMLLTPDELTGHKNISYTMFSPPYHFAYITNATLGETYETDVYMVLNKRDRLIHTDVFPEMAEIRFLPNDFKQLENDISIGRIYSNSEFDSYLIHALD